MTTATNNDTITLDITDVKLARKALSKAVRDNKKREEIDQANSKQAQMKAESTAYRIMLSKQTRDGLPHAWMLSKMGDSYFNHFVQTPSETAMLPEWHRLIVTADGTVVFTYYSMKIIAVATNCGGWVQTLFLQDQYTGEITCQAIGVHGDRLSLAHVPGVTMDDFRATV